MLSGQRPGGVDHLDPYAFGGAAGQHAARAAILCRAICPELSGETVSLKEIAAARNARRKQLRGRLATRSTVVDTLLALHDEPLPAAYPATTGLRQWNPGQAATTV